MKAAGTSITRTLEPTLQWNDLVLGSTPFGEAIQNFYRQRFNLHKHSRAQEVQQAIGKELWEDYFTFTFVRHPYDRAISLYTWVKGMVESDGLRRFFPFKMMRKKPFWNFPGTQAFMESKSFSDFIRNTKLLELAPGFKPQADWVVDQNGKAMVDFIGKVENIGEDFQRVARQIKCEAIELGRHNRSGARKNNQPSIQTADREYLYDHFRKDFDMFGYDFDRNSQA